MSSLPSEILTLIFNHLEIKGLLHCQLTSKQWHINSLTHIYSNVDLYSGEEARLFIRAISNSPQLGKYLNIIDLSDVLNGMNDEILETITQHCPNITEIKCSEKYLSFWTQLMHAGRQGQLPYLKVLPDPDYTNWKSYVYTALSFKNSLTSLDILGDDGLRGYRTLCDQLDQFKSLQRLDFGIQSYMYLSHFDGLIDKCPHLKELTFCVDTDAIQPPNEPEPMVRPRPDIHILNCDWELICTESQLEYVMRKFSNLQKLRIWATGREPEVSGPALIKFVQYAMSTPYFKLRILVKKEDLLNIFIEFMKAKNGCKNVTIGYSTRHPPSFVLCKLILFYTTGADVRFVSNTGANEAAHIQFLSKTGRLLRSLRLHHFGKIPDIKGEASESIDRLFDILQLCPLLEECTINHAESLFASHRKSKCPSLKKLSILGVKNSISLGFLNSLSLNLPNLCNFSLEVCYIDDNSTDPIVIDMPHSSLNLLIWNNYHEVKHVCDEEVYIRLKTERGLRYYSGNRRVLLPVDESCYLLATQNIRFDINCKDIKEFRREDLARLHNSWIF
ncbi:hypothetical protein EDC94DRAFT_690904 [Helicostylum pulchrum]|nr:hypothetical protein EDC94DRAFT_690904 [Helicostylum pulchrum]